ncbi:MAG TPA: DUF1906 domain-containing protein [Thermoanaerobaculia bacterium]|jgi:hypothetical protein|nr:DUF1906 domain-containing protein [Thermoanaerobaculia bacterium]
MALSGKVQAATAGTCGFDADSAITADVAQQFFALGYRFCVRYLSRGPESSGDLSSQEASDVLGSGLALMPVQHVRAPGWSPSGDLGQEDGAAAAANAAAVGFPSAVNVWCDLEGVEANTAASAVIDYCQAWFAAVAGAGYLPGLYVGAQAILTGQQLFDLSFQHYWRSQSSVPDVPGRGYQLIQLFPSVTVNGIGIDVDVMQTDEMGGLAQWLVQGP